MSETMVKETILKAFIKIEKMGFIGRNMNHDGYKVSQEEHHILHNSKAVLLNVLTEVVYSIEF